MSVMVVLGLIWAAVLVPPLLRARAERRAEFIQSFQAQMGTLGHKAQRCMESEAEARARRRATPVKRRRDILGGLLGGMVASLMLGAIPSLRVVWVLHLFLLNTFLGYVALLAHQRGLALRRQARPARAAASAPAARAARPARPARARRSRPVVEPVLAPALER